MRAEYLLFDLAIVAGPLALSLWPRLRYGARMRDLWWSVVIAAIPFVLWDAAVTGRHWWFNPDYVLGPTVLGLPIEEVGFFLAVPYACGFAWDTVVGASASSPRASLRWVHPLLMLGAIVGPVLFALGREYTGATLLAIGCVAWLDAALGTVVLRRPRYWAFAALVVGLTFVFNGYLTARPIVLYDPAMQLDLRLGTIPVEDFGFGFALTTAVVALFEHRRGRVPEPSLLARFIRRRLGGYRQPLGRIDPAAPARATRPESVAVIGGGLAGIAAAWSLARRGLQVTVFEREPRLGGKLAGWTERLVDGFEADVEHGFHAFFGHYHNLYGLLQDAGVRANMRRIEEYVVLARDGRRIRFTDESTTPGLNLLSLQRRGLFTWRQVLRRQTSSHLEEFLRYDEAATFERFDDVSYQEFAERADLPPELRTVFGTFARAFFADDARLSSAELIKSFHFYYLSHDHGLRYEYLEGSYARDLIAPLQERLESQGVQIRIGQPVERIDVHGDRVAVDGQPYDHVVLATDVATAAELVRRSETIGRRDPVLAGAMGTARAGQRYAVLRLWMPEPLEEELPVFVATQRVGVLDAVAFVHRTSPACRAWAREHGGSVLELHCYALPEDLPDDAVQAELMAGLHHYFPRLSSARPVHAHLQIRNDFTAFHTGMHAGRPGVRTGVRGLWLAGDWVALPCPAMLMEAAATSGLLAANAILEQIGVRGRQLFTVPRRGLMASLPRR